MNRRRPIVRISQAHQQPYLMRIADLLSDDPILTDVIGERFKVVAHCDRDLKRITFSFRCPDDTLPDEWDIKSI
jgi:hypothetical protein